MPSELKEFYIAGQDMEFKPAQAVIQGDTVFVKNNNTQKPVAVRFAWSKSASHNLFNSAGLPASPFRTDDWPATTSDNK